MKKIIFFILFINFCYSQEKELTIHEIDSIVKTSKNIIQSSGIIKKNKRTIGGFNQTEISFNNKLIYSTYGENTTDKENNFNHFYELCSSESYLVMQKILDAVKLSGAEAVHPGPNSINVISVVFFSFKSRCQTKVVKVLC